MLKKLIFLLPILFISLTTTSAQTVFGKYAGEFMAIGVGSRPLGMGGAFVGVADEIGEDLSDSASIAGYCWLLQSGRTCKPKLPANFAYAFRAVWRTG